MGSRAADVNGGIGKIVGSSQAVIDCDERDVIVFRESLQGRRWQREGSAIDESEACSRFSTVRLHLVEVLLRKRLLELHDDTHILSSIRVRLRSLGKAL